MVGERKTEKFPGIYWHQSAKQWTSEHMDRGSARAKGRIWIILHTHVVHCGIALHSFYRWVGGRERNVFLRVAHSSFRALLLSTFLVGNCIEEFASNKLNLVAYLRLCASAPIAVVWLLRTSHFLNRKFCNFNFQCDCLFVLIRCVWLVWFHGAQANSIFI